MPERLNVGKWWGDMLRRDTPLEANTGNGMNDYVIEKRSKIPSFTDHQIGTFEKALTDLINSLAEADKVGVMVRVDYEPDKTLCLAAAIAEIDIAGILPPKTMMVIEGDTVRVKVGYRAEWKYYQYAPERTG